MWADTILILVISICTALLGEVRTLVWRIVGEIYLYFILQGVTWLLVYRTEKYQKLKTEIEKQSKKLEKIKEAHGDTANLDRSKKRKIEQDEEKLKNTNRDLTMVKMKSMFAIGRINVLYRVNWKYNQPVNFRVCLHRSPVNVQLYFRWTSGREAPVHPDLLGAGPEPQEPPR